MRKVIFIMSPPIDVQVLLFQVLTTAAEVFLAAAGTTDRSLVVPSAFNQLVFCGHMPE